MTSEARATVIQKYEAIISLRNIFLHHIQRKQEAHAICIIKISILVPIPWIMGVASNSLAEFSSHKDDSIVFFVALIMKDLSIEVILGSSEEEIYSCGVVECYQKKIQLLCLEFLVCWGESSFQNEGVDFMRLNLLLLSYLILPPLNYLELFWILF